MQQFLIRVGILCLFSVLLLVPLASSQWIRPQNIGGGNFTFSISNGSISNQVNSGNTITFLGGNNVITSLVGNTLTINATGGSGSGAERTWTGSGTTVYNDTTDINVGIGTSSPSATLEVKSTEEKAVNFSDVFFVNGSSGYVGIGTTNPTEILHIDTGFTETTFNANGLRVDSAGSGEFNLFRGSSSSNANYRMGTAGGVQWVFGMGPGSSNFRLSEGFPPVKRIIVEDTSSGSLSDNQLYLANDGNTGIGTITPQAKLDVNGTLAINDGVTAPTNVPGKALIYVDNADGSLKVQFGNGTIKVLATN